MTRRLLRGLLHHGTPAPGGPAGRGAPGPRPDPAVLRPPSSRHGFPWALGLLLLARFAQPDAAAQAWLDAVDDALHVGTRDGTVSADLSVLADLEFYHADAPPPALLFDDGAFVNPRLTFFVDTRLGKRFYAMTQARIDRGFDPMVAPDGDARLDEYLLRYSPFADPRLNLQVGKFATVVGNWVPRHLSWDNPLINAPLPYENVAIMTDQSVPPGPGAFLGRKAVPDRKALWLPMLWGPSYAAGASAFGTLGRFDYAAEVKNASVSSRPSLWDPFNNPWESPTVSARLGWRPDAAWSLGVSGSGGAYLMEKAETSPGFPAGRRSGDFGQYTVSLDAGYARHRLQLWAEVFGSRFEVPNVGDADSLAYYLEAKYKLTAGLFVAARWNQQLFGSVRDASGGHDRWDDDAWRVDAGVGYRFTRHLQVKLQYTYNGEDGAAPVGENVLAAQLTMKF